MRETPAIRAALAARDELRKITACAQGALWSGQDHARALQDVLSLATAASDAITASLPRQSARQAPSAPPWGAGPPRASRRYPQIRRRHLGPL